MLSVGLRQYEVAEETKKGDGVIPDPALQRLATGKKSHIIKTSL